jgi:ParB family chromosome partitioning protein
LREVYLKDIDLKDDTFRVRNPGPDSRLLDSIRKVGLINPPWLKFRLDGEKYQIVMGFRRIMALEELGQHIVTARVVEEEEFTATRLMEMVILENLTHGPFDPVETSRALIGLQRVGIQNGQLIDRFLPLMSLSKDRATLDSYLSIVNLPEDIAGAISRGEVKIDSVKRVMRRFEGEDGESILRLIRDLRLGVNRQRELITLLYEITQRDEVSVNRILNGEEIDAFLHVAERNVPQSAQALMLLLRRMRSPHTMELVDRVKERVKELGLDPAVTLDLSPYLEERLMRISFGFRSREEYLRILENLTKLGEGIEVKGLMEDLFGKGNIGESERKDR